MMQVNRKIFDAHFHIGPYHTQRYANRKITPIPAELDHTTGDDCAAYLKRHHIQGGVIVPTYLEDQTAAFGFNQNLLEAVEAYDQLYGGLWVSPLPSVEALLQETLSLLPHPRIRALKIASNTWLPYSIDPGDWDEQVRRNVEFILDTAHAHNLVIHFHTGYLPGAHPYQFEAFMTRYGDAATYQFVHMGEAIAPAFIFIPRFIEWITRNYDVYTDTSIVPGFAPHWLIHELERLNLPCDRILFATDTPWGRFPSEYWKIQGLDIEEETKEMIFWKNATRLYRIEEEAM